MHNCFPILHFIHNILLKNMGVATLFNHVCLDKEDNAVSFSTFFVELWHTGMKNFALLIVCFPFSASISVAFAAVLSKSF